MDRFYWIVIAIATVIMIVVLTASAMMIRHEDKEATFPKSSSKCPDRWKYGSDGHCYYSDNRTVVEGNLFGGATFNIDGNLGTDTNKYNTEPTDIYDKVIEMDSSDANHGSIKFKEDAALCDKKKWADHHKIKWDGITNYNNC